MPVSPPSFGRLLAVTVITNPATTSFTARTDTTRLYVEGIGGGGGSTGPAASGATTNLSYGQPGGGAAYASVLISANIGTHTVAVGAGGTAGGTGTGNGGNGGDTTFADSTGANKLTAKGGSGATTRGAGATTPAATAGAPGGAASSCVGDLRLDGETGYVARLSGAAGYSHGGASPRGGGAAMVNVNGAASGSAGVAGAQYGGGAAPGIDTNNTARAGAAGAGGVLVVWEYA